MVESFLFSLNAVLPIILMVGAGFFIKKMGILSGEGAKIINKVVFRLLLPCSLFLNVYSIEDLGSFDFFYVVFAMVATVLIFLLAIPLSKFISKDNRQRGAMIQASFRSNYAFIGIPLATSLYGEEGAMIATVLSAFAIPLFNILAVICLTAYGEKSGKPSIKKVLFGIIKNPLILSIFLGFLCLIVRKLFFNFAIDFRLSDLTPVYSVLTQFGKTATPLALLALGAQFEFSAVPSLKKEIVFGTVLRMVLVPSIFLSAAYFMNCFSGAHFAALVALFATPVAISTVPMAQELGADTTLAGQLVVWTTILSAFTIFFFSFILKAVGVFV